MEIQLVCPQRGSAVSISSAELGHSFQSASCKETSGLRNRNLTAPSTQPETHQLFILKHKSVQFNGPKEKHHGFTKEGDFKIQGAFRDLQTLLRVSPY